MRRIKCVKPIPSEYITVGEEYEYHLGYQDQVCFRRPNNGPGSFMSYAKFKQCLREGSIVFADNK